ncbi:hypothetical protein IMZ48_19885, partial [Candidatus Bathyarchaeota archaeon]|nr:hypothetical protein [Candidatus Bathyarchaeota archaeon]
MTAAGLPLPLLLDRFEWYRFYASFNAITKEFSIQIHKQSFGNSVRETPWNQQTLSPTLPRPGVVQLQLSDADDAEFHPTRRSRPEMLILGTIELDGLEQHIMDGAFIPFRIFQDEDFAILFMKKHKRVYVWSFVENEEGEG